MITVGSSPIPRLHGAATLRPLSQVGGSMKLSLVVLQGKLEGKEIPIRLKQFVIGRDPQCHLRPASPLISKRHCAVLIHDGKVFLRDFESLNGTILNQQPLKGEVEIRNNDEFQVGPLTFRVKLEAGVLIDTPTPMPPTAAKAALPVKDLAKSTVHLSKVPPIGDEEMFGDLLMNIDDPAGSAATQMGDDPISADSTVMQLPALSLPTTETSVADAPTPAPAKADQGKKVAVVQQQTSDAAKAILEKYMKRPRPGATK